MMTVFAYLWGCKMNSILNLPASLRIVMFFTQMIVAGIFLFCIVYGIMCKRKKLYLSYISSLFVSLIVMIVTRTPVVHIHNLILADIFNLVLIVPATLGMFMFLSTKKPRYIIDSVLCILNITFFEFIPYYAYFISGTFFYVLVRSIILLFESLESVKNYPGRFAIKSAFDGLSDGIMFVNKFGQITYINKSLKNTLQMLGVSSHSKATKIVDDIVAKSKSLGRVVTDSTYIINFQNKSYKFSFDSPLSQISCIDVTKEENLIKQSEQNKILIENTNKSLNENLDKIEEIQREQELLKIKGQIHDNLAQQLSILHMFILNDNSTDLTELKTMLSSLEITQSEEQLNGSIENLQNLLKMIDVELVIKGEISPENALNTFVYKLIKETSTNAIRHGKATKIQVEFTRQDDCLNILISNNGIVPKSITFGNGLSSIQKELDKLNGTMQISTQNGFNIHVSIKK